MIHGDCMEIMPHLPGKFCQMVCTDIPYGTVSKYETRGGKGIRNLDKGLADVVDFDLHTMLGHLIRLCKGSIYIFCSTEQVSGVRAFFVKCKMPTRLLIWEKTNPSPMNGKKMWLSSIECIIFAKHYGAVFNARYRHAVLTYPTRQTRIHPTQKPVSLLKDIISVSSNPGDMVFDPFMGSGSTGVAAFELGRKFFGIEKNFEWFEKAKDRLDDARRKSQETGSR